MERLKDSSRYTWPWVALGLAIVIIAWTQTMIGMRWEHWASVALLLVPTWLGGAKGRNFSWSLFPLAMTGLAYENFRFIEAFRGAIHVSDIYHFDVRWFGVTTEAGRITWSEYFAANNNVVGDFICGLAYAIYVFQPILFPIIFFFTNQKVMHRMTWSWLVINLLGMSVYFLYPAAPPWYVAKFGFGPVDLAALPDPAGTLRFDNLLGISWFQSFYTRNANVFGAMPSLHAGYPLQCALAMWSLGNRWRVPNLLFAALLGFSALYLQHHYVIDVIVGYALALIAIGVVFGVERWRGQRAASTAATLPPLRAAAAGAAS